MARVEWRGIRRAQSVNKKETSTRKSGPDKKEKTKERKDKNGPHHRRGSINSTRHLESEGGGGMGNRRDCNSWALKE